VRTLYVVTHPEATHHVEGLVGGWFDSRLTDRGMRQAQAIADRLRRMVPTNAVPELISSDLTRTVQTAEVVGRPWGVAPVLLPGLRERSFGEAEGRPQGWLDKRYTPPPPTGDRLGHDEGIPGAESRYEFGARIYQAVDRILEGVSEHKIVITHGGALTFVVAAFTRLPLEAIGYLYLRSTSGGISTLGEDELHSRVVMSLNSSEHLTGS
jgi:probable phosphoglycerate mutase